jgi:S-adenosylmethionine hydrolase
MNRCLLFFVLLGVLAACTPPAAPPRALVLQSDFGTADGAVAAMKGVAAGVDPRLAVHDLTHEIPPYRIWDASFRLAQALPFWPEGTVVASIVDPGVGTDRASVVARTRDGKFIVGPDNGQLTHVHERIGLTALRRIDESRHRRPGSEQSHTFHGRDVYVLTAALLAAGRLAFEEVGPELPLPPRMITYPKASVRGDGVLRGNVPVLDGRYGNVWSDIGLELFRGLEPREGERFEVVFARGGVVAHREVMPYVPTFAAVPVGQPLMYLNSLMELSFALNQGSYAQTRGIGAGPEWSVEIRPAPGK